jgi:flagellin
MRINQNIASLNALRNLSVASAAQGKSLEKLSSGFRINRAADDAAGLTISENLRSQVGGLKMAMRNAQDGISVVQIAEGALTETHSILQRIRDLAVQAANSGATGEDAATAIQEEVDQLVSELDRIVNTTQYNGVNLLDGDFTDKTFQVGANTSDDDKIDVSVGAMSSADLGVDAIDVSDAAGAIDAMTAVDEAVKLVSTERSKLGAVQNRFEHTIANLGVAVENLSASEARIRDTDMAAEMAQLTRHQVLTQAGTLMLAQANSATQSVLTILQQR